MITLNENILDENLHQLIDNIDVETIKRAAKEQPNFRSFYLSYGQEGHLIDLLKSYFSILTLTTRNVEKNYKKAKYQNL